MMHASGRKFNPHPQLALVEAELERSRAALAERLKDETLISMRHAGEIYGFRMFGRRAHKSTMQRFGMIGARAASGRIIKLEAIWFNGVFCTSAPAVFRFLTGLRRKS